MICPECGYDMGNRNKCYRCGFEVKTLTVVDNADKDESQNADEEKVETKVIDPCNVYITHPYGVEDEVFGSAGRGFSSLFDELFGDPISDLLGGLFGINLNPRRSVFIDDPPPQPKKKRKEGPIIVVDDIEIIPAEEAKKNREEDEKREKHRNKKNKKH